MAKPIFCATHPRACSTAFERVFMTRKDLTCFHEPLGDAFYYGPERMSVRFEDEEMTRKASGYSDSTYKSVFDRFEREEAKGKRVFIKDMLYYLIPPDQQAPKLAPSLHPPKRGIGTENNPTGANGVSGEHHVNGINGVNRVNGHHHVNGTNGVNGHHHVNGINGVNGVNGTNGVNGHHHVNGINGVNGANSGSDHHHVNGTNGVNGVNGDNHDSGTNGVSKAAPFPYPSKGEPGNPTVVPKDLLDKFLFTFLVRDPHSSIPSFYRCTVPPLEDITGFHEYYPNEAGYDELRRFFDYAREIKLIQDKDTDQPNGTVNGHCTNGYAAIPELCLIDADDLLDDPEGILRAYCKRVGLEYYPDMLNWDDEDLQEKAKVVFEKWKGWHEDAIHSTDLKPRKHKKAAKSEEQWDAEWKEKFGEKAAKVIRKTVDENMADFWYLKQFAIKAEV